MPPPALPPPILTSCYYQQSVRGENIILRHAFAYQISGSLLVRDAQETVVFESGDFRFNVRNRLAKFTKQPAAAEPFRSLSLSFAEHTLQEFARKHNLTATRKLATPPSFHLPKHPLLQGFVDSLQPYLPYFEAGPTELVQHKLHEALLLLLQVQPDLQELLFDFAAPGKLNLRAFLEENFRYNLGLARLAYLTGRSVSGFKRDFAQEFNTTPARWLQQRRLQEAYYLLKEQYLRTTEVYLEVGFENLSHFSFAFKKHFGISPVQAANE